MSSKPIDPLHFLQRILKNRPVFHNQSHGLDLPGPAIRGIKQLEIADDDGDALQRILTSHPYNVTLQRALYSQRSSFVGSRAGLAMYCTLGVISIFGDN